MHSYLRAIGFSEVGTRSELEVLINRIINNPSIVKKYKSGAELSIVEYSTEYTENIGITVRGEEDKEGVFHYEHFFPYSTGMNVSCNEEIYVSKRVDTDAYTGMCDDLRVGVSLIFYIQNAVDYLRYSSFHKGPMVLPVTLSALALQGTIILPTECRDKDKLSKGTEDSQKSKLIAEAKKGNQEAIESLTMEDIDNYAIISQRIKNEDLFSIVETSFVPYGSESDIYNVLGNITDCEVKKNSETGEEVYIITISCNQVIFDICINRQDLIGEPSAGMRFRGTVWLQGNIDYNL